MFSFPCHFGFSKHVRTMADAWEMSIYVGNRSVGESVMHCKHTLWKPINARQKEIMKVNQIVYFEAVQ